MAQEVEQTYEEVDAPKDDSKGILLYLLSDGKPYIFLTIQDIDDSGKAVVTMDHNSPVEAGTRAIRQLLVQVLNTLPRDEAAVPS